MSIAISEPLAAFLEAHPLRIELPDGTCLRFRDLIGGARSAVWHKQPLWDESGQRQYSVADCIRMTASADRARRMQ